MSESIFEPGRNCWRMAKAGRAAVIVDACDYYRIIRHAMLDAKQHILLIGWDFDPRIALDRTEPGREDETLGQFFIQLTKDNPKLRIDILKWDVGALKMLFRGSAILWLLRLSRRKGISFEFDHAHPAGCSHHQKIVVIDDCFAICGGIDMTSDRWDKPAHNDDDPGRVRPNGKPYGPWHDVTMAVDGAAAQALGELGRARWKIATGKDLRPVENATSVWPGALAPMFRDTELAIARTRAEYEGVPEVCEVEALFIDMITLAKRFIYAENQYFTSPKIAAAIAARMAANDPPEIVLINPEHADGWLEQKAMDGARVRLAQVIGHADTHKRFRIYHPVTAGGEPIYVHAKVMIVDDRILRVGSSNMNNRSLGLDTECDLAMDNREEEATIAGLRTRLMAEHLGTDEARVTNSFAETGSLIETIEALSGTGKTLRLIEFEKPGDIEKFIADNELLDPESPDKMFEPLSKRSLFARFRYSGRKSGTDK